MHITLTLGVLTISDDEPDSVIQIREDAITEVGYDSLDGYWLYAGGIQHAIDKPTMHMLAQNMHSHYITRETGRNRTFGD